MGKAGRPPFRKLVDAEGVSLGEFLKASRFAKGISQLSASAVTDVTRVAISDYERDAYAPSPDTLNKLLGLYGVALDQDRFTTGSHAPYADVESTPRTVTVRFECASSPILLDDVIRLMTAAKTLFDGLAESPSDVVVHDLSLKGSELTLVLSANEVSP